jgi:hypothetical protein
MVGDEGLDLAGKSKIRFAKTTLAYGLGQGKLAF